MTCDSIYGNIQGCATPITIATQGATGSAGATGAAGSSILNNDRTREAADANISLQTLHTYTIDNVPTVVLDTNGDAIYMEAMFNIAAGVSGTVLLEWGVANTVISYPINAALLTETNIILKAFITRTGDSTQDVEAQIVICGTPDLVWTKGITTNSQDLTADVIVKSRCQKDLAGVSGDITCNYLKVIKYEI